MRFPEDFISMPHSIVTGGKQWLDKLQPNTTISIVGGAFGLYGDGVRTFEMYDFREGDIQGHLTIDEINAHLEKHPIT